MPMRCSISRRALAGRRSSRCCRTNNARFSARWPSTRSAKGGVDKCAEDQDAHQDDKLRDGGDGNSDEGGRQAEDRNQQANAEPAAVDEPAKCDQAEEIKADADPEE